MAGSGVSALGLGALVGAVAGLCVWAAASWGAVVSALGCGAIGVGGAGWLVHQSRRKHSDYRDELVATLEQRIAERMDDLAKLDSRLELRRMVGGPPTGGATRRQRPLDLGTFQQEAASFGRRLETACREVSDGVDCDAAETLEALAGHFAGLRDRIDVLVEEAGPDAIVDGVEDLGGLLTCVAQRARRSRGGIPAIDVEVAPDLPLVRCSANRIERALLLLLEHACESAGETGQVEAQVRESAGGVEVTVCGRGAGLDPECVEEVFDPFLGEGSEAAPGGDELRTAACIVTEHGGSLQLQPDPELGMRASFLLPLAETD